MNQNIITSIVGKSYQDHKKDYEYTRSQWLATGGSWYKHSMEFHHGMLSRMEMLVEYEQQVKLYDGVVW